MLMHLKEVPVALRRTSVYHTFGFFEDVMHLKEVQVALERTSYGQCHKEQILQSKTGQYDGLSKEEICRVNVL